MLFSSDTNIHKKSEETACPNWYAPTAVENSNPFC
jgi:hypothetical protein